MEAAVVRVRGGERAHGGAAERARRVQLRGGPARGQRVHAALQRAALRHQVHAHRAQVLCHPLTSLELPN